MTIAVNLFRVLLKGRHRLCSIGVIMTTLLVIGSVWVTVSILFCVAICLAARRAVPAMPILAPVQETILAIDDDATFLSATKDMLESEGYHVITASSPKEGIESFANHCEEIRLVLLDFLMPEMNGDRVFEKLHAIAPNVPVMLVTGYLDNIPQKRNRDGFFDYLPKPFRFDDFATKVRSGVEFSLANSVS